MRNRRVIGRQKQRASGQSDRKRRKPAQRVEVDRRTALGMPVARVALTSPAWRLALETTASSMILRVNSFPAKARKWAYVTNYKDWKSRDAWPGKLTHSLRTVPCVPLPALRQSPDAYRSTYNGPVYRRRSRSVVHAEAGVLVIHLAVGVKVHRIVRMLRVDARVLAHDD